MSHDDEPEAGGMSPPSHGQLTYLQIPARDVSASAVFYATVFGWEAGPAGSGFEAPGLIGQFVDDRPAAVDAGLLAWIFVDHIDDTLALVAVSGGEVLEPPSLDDGVRWLATIRDPGGNAVGIVGTTRR